MVVTVRLYSHFLVTCMSISTYSSIKTPSSRSVVFLVLLVNSRFMQNLYTIGAWASAGFLSEVVLLTVLLFFEMHWNKEECEILCRLQPQITEHYHDIKHLLPGFLVGSGDLITTADICLACRYILQVVFGCVLPLFLAVRRELASRSAFATEERLRTRPLRAVDILMQSGVILCQILATLAVLITCFTLFPYLDHLPTLLNTVPLSVLDK
eukprot:jgi/Botrbrau1/13306/Bobra.0315s0004.1